MTWPKVPLGDVVEINPRFRGWEGTPDETEVTFVPMSAVSELTASIEVRETRSARLVRKGYTPFREGDVLFAKITPCMENGKAALARGLVNGIGFGSTEFHVLRSKGSVLPEFVYYFLRQDWFRAAAKRRMTGAVGQQRVPEDFLIDYRIPLPPICEQRRIVEILDRADALRKERAAADTKVERILPALFIKMFGNPSKWSLDNRARALGSLVDFRSGATPSKQRQEYWQGQIPWVSPKDMKQEVLSDSTDHLSTEAVEATNLKYIEPASVLIVVRGMILAHSVPIAIAGSRLTINQDLKALIPKQGTHHRYLFAALKASTSILLSKVRTAAHGTRKLDMEDLSGLPILVPDPDTMKKFVILSGGTDAIVADCRKSTIIVNQLFSVLLHRAFSGTLTARWRHKNFGEVTREINDQELPNE